MGIRFAKSIKIGNFLRLNFSKNGVSATVGKKGASVNIGGKGTYLNLSPSAVGINGTGLSYRQKITGGLLSNKKKTKKAKKNTVASKKTSTLTKKEQVYDDSKIKETVNTVEENVVEERDLVAEYLNNQEAIINLHKYTDDVMTKEEFAKYVDTIESEGLKEIYQAMIEGDEDTIENMISSFMNNLELAYDVRVNYELEENILYADLDLPEIEDLIKEYPVYSRGEVVFKKKTMSQLKEEYAKMVLSLGVFLTANYFNISSYIDEVVMSAFTTVRDRNGDLVDQYPYSIRYDRDTFEKTKLSDVDDLYEFMMQFTNRINLSANNTFKAIKPYEMESVMKSNELLEDALEGLRGLGYKASEVNAIAPKLSEYRYDSSAAYLKEGLRLLKENK